MNASKNWNEGGHTDIDVNAASFLSGRSDIVLKEGYPLSSFWSYSFAGLDGKPVKLLFNLFDIPEEERSRQIDPTTYLVYSGQKDPYFTGGLSLSFRYKSLTLNTSFSLLLGNKKRLPSPYEQFASSLLYARSIYKYKPRFTEPLERTGRRSSYNHSFFYPKQEWLI